MDINCRKLNCKYNNKCVCMAKGVCVAGSTVCDTYEKDAEKEVHDITKTMFQKTPKYENFRHIKKANIECGAPCMFNRAGKCVANGIIVLTGEKNPVCGTYLCDSKCCKGGGKCCGGKCCGVDNESSQRKVATDTKKKQITKSTSVKTANKDVATR